MTKPSGKALKPKKTPKSCEFSEDSIITTIGNTITLLEAPKSWVAKVKTKLELLEKNELFLPKYNSDQDACAELTAKIPIVFAGDVPMPAKVLLNHRSSLKVKTGIRVEVPSGFKLCVSLANSFSEKGLVISNAPIQFSSGIQDIEVHVINVGRELIEIKYGDKFAQCWLEPVYRFEWEVVDKLGA